MNKEIKIENKTLGTMYLDLYEEEKEFYNIYDSCETDINKIIVLG